MNALRENFLQCRRFKIAAFVLAAGVACHCRADTTPTAAAPTKSSLMLQDGDLLAICGDSITEQKKYSVYMEDYLLMCQPIKLRTLQAGVGGATVGGFVSRMARDLLILKPTVITTCYGMNDGGFTAITPQIANGYRRSETAMVRQFKAAGVRNIIIGSPGVVDSDSLHRPVAAEVYNQTLGALGDVGREVAAQEGVGFADLHGPMMDVMRKAKEKYGRAYQFVGGDGVHPGSCGHIVMAYAFLKALGCDGNIGTITLDLGSGAATATEGHRILSSDKSVAEIESTRYPFCFFGKPEDSDSPKGVLDFLPFNEDLNRLTLVVKGAAAESKYKVTWGTVSKIFTGAKLGQGINLAAEFLDNPFSQAFQTVDTAVSNQQAYETVLTKQFLEDLPVLKASLPEETATFEGLSSKFIARDQAMAVESTAAVVPVKHVIKIELVP